MSTPVAEDGWSSPTHYAGGQPVEPRMFTEADPMGSVLVSDWDDARWGDTTLVGKPRRRRKGPAHSAAEPAASSSVAEPAADEIGTPEIASAELGSAELGSAEIGSAEIAAVDSAVAWAGPDARSALDESSTRGLMAASGSIAVASLASRVTGFVRSILLVAALGTAAVGNAYNSGNNLPNMIYELLLGGVLSSVLIPLLVRAQSQDDDDGVAYTQRLLSIAAAALGVMTLLAVLAAPLIAAAFVHAGPQRELTSIFATLLLPEIFFYGIGAMFIAVLNIRHVYGPGA